MTGAVPNRVRFWPVFVLLTALSAVPIVVVCPVRGLGRALRDWFAFRPGPRPEGVDEALVVWAANGRVLAFVLLASVATVARRLVPVLDLVVGVFVVVNVALVGLALGAYGQSLLPWLVHVPVEWAALAVALVVYRDARRRGPRPRVIAEGGLLAAVVLGVAAAIETWATPFPLP